MASSSLLICGLARDCATNLQNLIPAIEKLGSAFKRYSVIVVENDSQDETGHILEEWAIHNPDVTTIRYCYIGANPRRRATGAGDREQSWFGFERIERISFARNLYLAALRHEDMRTDYTIVIDLDIQSFSLGGIESCFGVADQWDVITANGRRVSGRHPLRGPVYWDSYAYEPIDGFPGGVQTADFIKSRQLDVSDRLKELRFLPARSAFGGLACYRSALLERTKYGSIPNASNAVPVLCEHHALHRGIRVSNGDYRLLISSDLEVQYASTGDLLRRLGSRILGQ